jgi:hypothetical protein
MKKNPILGFVALLCAAASALAAGCSPEGAPAIESAEGALAVTRSALADAHVRDGSFAAENYGASTELIVKQASSSWTRWSYLTFDVSNLGGSLASAQVRLYGQSDPGTSVRIGIFPVADVAWSESGITWNNRPAAGSTALTVVTVDATAAARSWDVTAYVKAQLAAGATRVSFVVKDTAASNVYVTLSSRESANSPALLTTVDSATPSTAPPPSSASSPTVAGCPVLPADNDWNRAIAGDPVDPSSATWMAHMNAGSRLLHPDFASNTNYGIPWITVPGTQAKVPMSFTYADESDPGPYPYPSNAPIEGGSNGTGDRHVIVLDRDNCRLYETFSSFLSGSGWHADSGAKFDLRSNTLRPDGWTSADAAGLPILPGLVRKSEVAAGRIAHALRFTVQRTQRAYVRPATHFASSITDPGYPPLGIRVRLKASFDISRFNATTKVILTAMKEYGMFLADNGGDWFFTGEANGAWNDDELQQLKTVPASAFEVVKAGTIHR